MPRWTEPAWKQNTKNQNKKNSSSRILLPNGHWAVAMNETLATGSGGGCRTPPTKWHHLKPGYQSPPSDTTVEDVGRRFKCKVRYEHIVYKIPWRLFHTPSEWDWTQIIKQSGTRRINTQTIECSTVGAANHHAGGFCAPESWSGKLLLHCILIQIRINRTWKGNLSLHCHHWFLDQAFCHVWVFPLQI